MGETREQKRERLELFREGKKRCSEKSGCGEVKPLNKFGADNGKSDGKQSLCLICNRKRCSRYYNENKEARIASSQQHYRDNLEERQEYGRKYSREYSVRRKQEDPMFFRLNEGKARAKKAGVEYEDISSTVLINYWKQKGIDVEVCYYCKKTINEGELEIDHGIPLGRGGGHTRNNLFPAHKSCNLSKGKRTVEEYLEHLIK